MSEPTSPLAPQPNVALITITFDPATSQVAVNGNIENKLLAFGMLELAKEAVSDYHRQAQARIQAPSDQAVRAFGKPGIN